MSCCCDHCEVEEIPDSPFPPIKPDIQEAWRIQRNMGQLSELLGDCREGTHEGEVYCQTLKYMNQLRGMYTPELTGEELDLLAKIDPKHHKLYSRGVLDSFEIRANVWNVKGLEKLSLL